MRVFHSDTKTYKKTILQGFEKEDSGSYNEGCTKYTCTQARGRSGIWVARPDLWVWLFIRLIYYLFIIFLTQWSLLLPRRSRLWDGWCDWCDCHQLYWGTELAAEFDLFSLTGTAQTTLICVRRDGLASITASFVSTCFQEILTNVEENIQQIIGLLSFSGSAKFGYLLWPF